MKRKLSLVLILTLVLALALPVAAQNDTALDAGLSFVAEDKYCMTNSLNEIPSTFEATIYIPEDFAASDRPGTIVGNYAGLAGCVNLEIHQNGRFRYYAIDSQNHIFDYVFDQTDLRTGQWTHIALVRDLKAGLLTLYINGEVAQTKVTTEIESYLNTTTLVVGGDCRAGNSVYFKGRILNLAMYGDMRTTDEIRSDMTACGKDDLLVSYDFSANTGASQPDQFADQSANANQLKMIRTWSNTAPSIGDYDYAIAIIPDTQVVTYYYPDQLPGIYDWIVENAAAKKIQFVMGLGDITERSTDAEWLLAKENITKMNGVVRYSLVRGNHDTYNTFCKYFPYAEMENMGGSFDYMPTNTWQEIRMGGLDYMIFALDYGADDDVLAWAGEVIAAHPNHNVIITTHSYLFRDGTTLDEEDVCAPSKSGGTNNGDHMWDKLISQYENIVMVVCGHDPSDEIVVTQTQGVHGNTVTQMLIDAQSVDLSQQGVGMVAIAYFSNGGKTVQMEYYSTVKDQWFLDENQFTMTVDVVAPAAQGQDTPAVDNNLPIINNDGPQPDWPVINTAVIIGIVVVAAGVITVVIVKKKKKEV